jgi:acetylornithine deacetylase/succinyl-diaminopimelate desuccinylase-like protein
VRPADLHIDIEEVTELAGALIRNKCINTCEPDGGHEHRNVATLRNYLDGVGLEISTFEPHPGRQSMVARLAGTDPDAPRVTVVLHTDVVPVSPQYWDRDPFCGEVVDGELWGRGAIDVLGLLATQAVALRHLAANGLHGQGDLTLVAAADEEGLGVHGTAYLVDTQWELLDCDYALGELGGVHTITPAGHSVAICVAEKGFAWRRLTVRGTPGHGGIPLAFDNALIKTAEVIRRLVAMENPKLYGPFWAERIRAFGFPTEVEELLLNPDRFDESLALLPDLATRGLCHAMTHSTLSVNAAHGGQNVNMIPDSVNLTVDTRLIPGDTPAELDQRLQAALGDLAASVEISAIGEATPSESPTDTVMWQAIRRAVRREHPAAELSPTLLIGLSDNRFFRQRGVPSYGVGLMSLDCPPTALIERLHGHNERIDLESLRQTTGLWLNIADQFFDPLPESLAASR